MWAHAHLQSANSVSFTITIQPITADHTKNPTTITQQGSVDKPKEVYSSVRMCKAGRLFTSRIWSLPLRSRDTSLILQIEYHTNRWTFNLFFATNISTRNCPVLLIFRLLVRNLWTSFNVFLNSSKLITFTDRDAADLALICIHYVIYLCIAAASFSFFIFFCFDNIAKICRLPGCFLKRPSIWAVLTECDWKSTWKCMRQSVKSMEWSNFRLGSLENFCLWREVGLRNWGSKAMAFLVQRASCLAPFKPLSLLCWHRFWVLAQTADENKRRTNALLLSFGVRVDAFLNSHDRLCRHFRLNVAVEIILIRFVT